MQILDMERETGLDRATIRFYEKEGIVVPQRQENGYRSYSEDDLKLLLKIKLLRQLGVSVFKIKCLQKGSEDFSQLLTEQIKALEEKILLDKQAKYVCEQMQRDGAQYATLNAAYYLHLLQTPNLSNTQRFQESIQKESHPWRRYFARMLDYVLLSTLCNFLLIVIFRIRPYGNGWNTLVDIAAYFIAIPVFAIMLHNWGTTPGKWAMGIKIENINGGKLSYYDAFQRECDIIWSGLGFFIPILSQWRLYESYRDDTSGEENYWNHTSEVIYTNWTAVKKSCLVGLYCISLLIGCISACDSYMPRYIGNRITLKKFAESHFAYEKQFNTRTELKLGEDGKWKEDTEPHTVYMTFDSIEEVRRPDFQFKLDEGYVKAVRYTNSWESQSIYSAIPEYCLAAMYTMVGSRPGATYFDLLKMEDQLSSTFANQLQEAVEKGSCNGSFIINDVNISWDIHIVGCEWEYQDHLFAEDGDTLQYSLDLNIEIID